MLDDLTIAIRSRTAHIVAHRFTLENERHESRKKMAIEIKGLRSDALLARANIDRVREAYRKFNEAAPAHAADVDKLAGDITGMQSDLEFAAAVMGNSADASEKLPANSVAPQSILAGVGDLNFPKAAPEPTAAQQMPAMPTTDRVALGPHPDQPETPEQVEQRILKEASKAILSRNEILDDIPMKLVGPGPVKLEVGIVPSPTFRAAE